MSRKLTLVTLISAALFTGTALAGAVDQEQKIDSAIEVLDKTVSLPEDGIPPSLLRNAKAIAIVPGVIKAGFIIGGSYGKGIMTVRDGAGRWSPPVFIKLAAGSLGWQIGAQSTDVVLVFKTARSVDGIVKGKFTLGADAAIAAGPVGRRGEAATDAELKAEILSYSRSRGLFAGVSLEGSNMEIDNDANAAYYGTPVKAADILEGKVVPPPSTLRLMQSVFKAVTSQ